MPAVPAIIMAGASIGGAAIAARSAGNTARRQADAYNQAAITERQSALEALDFAKQQEAERKRQFDLTQQRNFEIYQQQRRDLEPYRRLGAGAIGQMARPIPRVGSLGQMIGG